MPVLSIEIAYVGPQGQWLVEASLPEGATVADAIAASGLLQTLSGLVVDDDHVGIHGRRVALAAALADGDRVELYRPLLADPKEARRRRARR
jgi:putative ubiquitin-RnfH superfamily antitoxin RatB of RatAB toxin-antitoxin module